MQKSKYETNVLPFLAEIGERRGDGASMTDISNWLKVSRTSIWQYINKYPEFAEVMEEANERQNQVIEDVAVHSLLDKLQDRFVTVEEIYEEGVLVKEKKKLVLADTTAIIFALKARNPKAWDALGVARLDDKNKDEDLSAQILASLSAYNTNEVGDDNEVPNTTES